MRPFNSKDGRTIVPFNHYIDFTGKNNNSKGKVLIWLLHIKGKHRTARQLHDETGVNYNYLRARLSFWYNIRYLNRHAILPSKGRPVWAYSIAERGEHFVNDMMPIEKRNDFTTEINFWRRAITDAKQ